MERYIKITDDNDNGAVLYDGPVSGIVMRSLTCSAV